jgi:transcriptional regulator with XRE-family HTH domain
MADRSASSLGEIIRQQRELAELSMRQFAELAGISNPYLSQIERGLRAPSETVLDSIARTLKVSADALYKEAGMPAPGAPPEANVVLDAIAVDPQLTARQRAALREVYAAFVAASPRQARRREPSAESSDGGGDGASVPASNGGDGASVPASDGGGE